LFNKQTIPSGLPPALASYLKRPNWAAVQRDLEWASKPGRAIITLQHQHYPALLREIVGSPPVLYACGNLALLATPQIGIVGSRNPTVPGVETAQQFASYLANRGYTITSGLALGIDAAAHQGALSATGATIGVLGSGLEKIYPAQHQQLAYEIANQGLLLSEFPPNTAPKGGHFPQRNRIISGLSMGTLVVEASIGSGSLITAKFAVEQGREVFAIPGSIHNPLARGCHQLIRQGAKLVETAQDIIEELGALTQFLTKSEHSTVKPQPALQLADEDIALLQCVGFEPTPIDNIIKRSGLTAEKVSSMLLLLELQGAITSSSGGYIRVA
jgi:DNA processing protein